MSQTKLVFRIREPEARPVIWEGFPKNMPRMSLFSAAAVMCFVLPKHPSLVW